MSSPEENISVFAKLPQETLHEVFGHLTTNKGDLVNCALVCRSWCKHIVPLIWDDPIGHLSPYGIRVLLSFMPEKEKNTLREIDPTILNVYPPLFEYPSYITKFRLSGLYKNLPESLKKRKRDASHRFSKIVTPISEMIFNRSKGLRLLEIKNEEFNYVPDFIQFKTIESSLERLRVFAIDYLDDNGEHRDHLIDAVLTSSKRIQRLDISQRSASNSTAPSLIKLIEQLELCEINFRYEINADILSALSFQQDSLTSLTLHSVNCIDLSFMANLRRLQTLQLLNWKHHASTDDYIQTFWLPFLSAGINLSSFYFSSSSSIDSSFIVPVISNPNQELKQLTFKCRPNPAVYPAIEKHCQNLSTLAIDVDVNVEATEALISCLENLHHLSQLALRNASGCRIDDQVATRLASAIPNTVVQLLFGFYVSPETFEAMLGNLSARLKRIVYAFNAYPKLRHIDALKTYATNKDLKLKLVLWKLDNRQKFCENIRNIHGDAIILEEWAEFCQNDAYRCLTSFTDDNY